MRQYQGTSSSSTFQDTVMTYDGHGRLVTQKAPIEASPSIYAYYADDTLKSRTDPRSARANFAYNGRHLATGISYCKPLECDGGQDDGSGEISPSASVAFGYDSAGNRISMTDGLGSVLYQYDIWSRLKSEARYLSDLNQTKTISYDYNLANELTSLTDPFNSVTTYAYNQAGQLSSVSGSGPASAPAYISQIQYRAWGAPKQITCGNGVNMTTGYNTRLQATSFSTAGLMGATLSYYSDGRIHTEQSVDRKFDRAYTYDHAGRLTDALSGSEAGLGSTLGGPYHQAFGYDVFGNMKDRSGQLWSAPGDAYSTGYVNDRNSAWGYDGAGNPTTQETLTAKYNSAGQRSSTTSPARHIGSQIVNLKLFEGYDGDGQQVAETRETMVGSTTTQITTYKIRSSVLGGQIVAELTSTGAKQTGYVYANGRLIARQQFGSVTWVHLSPTNLSERWTNTSGQFAGASEYDPAHSAVGLDDPGPGPDGTSADLLYPRNGDPTDLSGGCTIDGMVAPCSVAMSVVNVGAGVATDPYETPSTRWNQTLNGGQGGFEIFHAFADGNYGYLPITAHYAKNGAWWDNVTGKEGRLGQSSGDSRNLLNLAFERARELLRKKACGDFVGGLLYTAFIQGAGAGPESFEALGAILELTSAKAVASTLEAAVAKATIKADTPNENRAESVYGSQSLTVYRDFFKQHHINVFRVNDQPRDEWSDRSLLQKAQTLVHEGLHLTIKNGSDATFGEIISKKTIAGSLDARRAKGSAIINDAVERYCNGRD